MNRIHKTIYSHTLGAWVAVAEVVKGRGKKSRGEQRSVVSCCLGGRFSIFALLIIQLGLSSQAIARDRMYFHVNRPGTPSATANSNNEGKVYNHMGGATGEYATAAGIAAQAKADFGISVGFEAKAGTAKNQENAIAIGSQAISKGQNTIAIGAVTRAFGSENTALGYLAWAGIGSFATATGARSSASGESSTANGYRAKAAGQFATATGADSVASGDSSSAFGREARASSQFTTAIGANSLATGESSTANGHKAEATSQFATAIGANSLASGDSASALGREAQATAESATALGRNTRAAAQQATAVGSNAQALAKNAVAIGHKAKVTGASSISIGTGNVVTGSRSGAIGDPTYINADDSYAIGNNNTIAVGSNKVFVLGNNVNVGAGNTGAVVLGDKSTVEAAHIGNYTLNGTRDAQVAGSKGANTQVVSVGAPGAERQIQNVAPGVVSPASTDAVNGSQLYHVARQLGSVQQDLAKVRADANAGAASAIAIASMGQSYKPGGKTVGIGVGTYRGQSAISIGGSIISGNGKWILKGAINTNTRGHTGAGASVNYHW